MSTVEAEKKMEEEEKVGGEILFCGATGWDTINKKQASPETNLFSPARLRPLIGVDIRFVASGCVSTHCVALDVEGRCYTWGKNEKGQLGHGDTIQRDRPTVVSELLKYKITKAGAGRSHTVVLTEDGNSLSFGWNKHGQLGSGSLKNEMELSPVNCLVSEVTTAVCGGEFTVWLSSVQGSSILNAGHPQYGQLGHGTDREYNTKEASVKLAYEPQPRPKAIPFFAEKTVVKVACGTNHTVAVDSNGFVYTWGNGGYGRLGHREQKDEFTPRLVDVFQRHNVLPPNAIVSAGSVNSAVTAGGGQLYMWGKIKSTGDDWMYPKPLMDLSGWNIRCMDSGSMHHFVGADDSCISWGHAQHGELGYGPNEAKSSANPKKVDSLNGMHVIHTACGLAHSMIVVDRTNMADRLDQLEVYDGKAAGEGSAVPEAATPPPKKGTKKPTPKASSKSKKRKKDSSDSEEEEEENESNQDSENEDAENDDTNGEIEKKQRNGGKGGRGRPAGKKSAATEEKKSSGRGRGRGRGRPPSSEKKTPQTVSTGKRGRPRKS